ncbi:MAG: hypothetical protein SGI97_03525 [candidate division Zixibacteria bacterium]|nr:hypothetical protein [candidate division Zixibacteria bacterium]
MKKQGIKWIGICAIFSIFSALMFSCSQNAQSDPREVVIALFGAMEKNDDAALFHLLDVPELMKNKESDYSLNTDEPRVFHNPQDVVKDLMDGGLTKERWFAYQRIIGKASITGDAGSVDVMFVDKDKSQGYRTRFGVHKVGESWKIYSFKTIAEGS